MGGGPACTEMPGRPYSASAASHAFSRSEDFMSPPRTTSAESAGGNITRESCLRYAQVTLVGGRSAGVGIGGSVARPQNLVAFSLCLGP